MIVQSVFIGKSVDYSPGTCRVYGVLTLAYQDNKYWLCVGEFQETYLRPETVLWRRNKTCWKGRFGVPFNDDSKEVRMIADDSLTALFSRLYGEQATKDWALPRTARSLEELQTLFTDKDPRALKPIVLSTRRGKPTLDPCNPTIFIYKQPVVFDSYDLICLPDAGVKDTLFLLRDALERCLGHLMSEVLLATTDSYFQSEGEWDFLKK